ncbi:MAG: hypothetical protein V2A54_15200 [Bacteroidota bacterium]
MLLIIFACNNSSKEKVVIKKDSLTVVIDTALFQLSDTAIHSADGGIQKFRKVKLTNNTCQSVYFELPFNRHKVIRAFGDPYFFSKQKVWDNPFSTEWNDCKNYCELKKGQTDTFMISDLFAYGDSAVFALNMAMDKDHEKIYKFRKFFYQDKNKKVYACDFMPASYKKNIE